MKILELIWYITGLLLYILITLMSVGLARVGVFIAGIYVYMHGEPHGWDLFFIGSTAAHSIYFWLTLWADDVIDRIDEILERTKSK